MYSKIYSNPDIYKLDIPLPDSPLKNLNCYLITTDKRNLIVDTGFNQKECLDALKESLEELNISMNNTDIFLTHLHSDHIGLVPEIMSDNTIIYMSETDKDYLVNHDWDETNGNYLREGFPPEDIDILNSTNPAKEYGPSRNFDVHIIYDDYKIKLGEYEFTCIATPGHTPGHMCLYLPSEGILFLGDHVLFDITPNITTWNGVETSLFDYLNSLNKVLSFEIKVALPGHRKNDMDVYERINKIIEHHDLWLEEIINIIEENPGISGYEVASKMKWSMRGKAWSVFPMHQKWFAVGETIAHLELLVKSKKIIRAIDYDNINKYFPGM